MNAYFDRFTITMTLEDARSCSHQGQCDEDVSAMVASPKMAKQLAEINPVDIMIELEETGGWEEEELTDTEQNQQRIVWIAAGNIIDEWNEAVRGR